MKKTIAALITILGVGTCFGQSGGDLFNEHEMSLFAFGSYVDKPDSKVAPGIGVSYFLTKLIGVSASTYWQNYSGTFIDNIDAEATFRWPLPDLPLAPYALVGVGYSFESEGVNGFFGGGAEWRFDAKWGVFGDIRWQINDKVRDGVGIRFGMRLVF